MSLPGIRYLANLGNPDAARHDVRERGFDVDASSMDWIGDVRLLIDLFSRDRLRGYGVCGGYVPLHWRARGMDAATCLREIEAQVLVTALFWGSSRLG